MRLPEVCRDVDEEEDTGVDDGRAEPDGSEIEESSLHRLSIGIVFEEHVASVEVSVSYDVHRSRTVLGGFAEPLETGVVAVRQQIRQLVLVRSIVFQRFDAAEKGCQVYLRRKIRR